MLTIPPMQLISMLVFKEKADALLLHLAYLGVFQPIDPRRIEKELNALAPLELNAENNQWQALEQQLGRILQKLGIAAGPVQSEENFSFQKIKEYFTSLEEKLSILTVEREKLRQELKIKERMLSQVTDFMPFALRDSSLQTFLEVKLGKLEEKNIVLLEKKLQGIPCIIYPAKKYGNRYIVWLIGLRRDKVFFDNVLKDVAWQKVELPQLEVSLPKGGQQQLKSEIEEYRVKFNEASATTEKLAQLHSLKLSKVQSFIAFKKALLEAKKCFRSTDQLVLICGWVPQEEKERVVAEAKKIAKLSYIEKKTVPELDIPKEEVPVRMLHNRIFKPFELLIATYGVPRYGTIDPTFFVAITFLLMFGAMFGDLGQGLIFVLASFFLRKSKKVTLKQAANLLLYCGLSASVFGLLYGTIFGLEGIIPAFWIKPMENIGQLFNTAITFGIIIIVTGVVINIINAVRDRDYLKAFFDKAGLIAAVVYLTAIAYVIKLFVSKTKISHFYIILIFFGLALLFAKPFVEIFFKKDKESESFFVSFMEGIVDIMEIVMGYLANTVSFIRVAAFSLAHVGLFLAIFELSHLLKNVGSGLISILVIILGNILIMLLEGLVVTIQSLRLNYYEFFSKFFMYGKQFYKPLTTGSR